MTAEDVAYAIKRSFAIEELPDGPTYQTTFFLDGDKYKVRSRTRASTPASRPTAWTSPQAPLLRHGLLRSFPAFTAIPEAKDNPETYGQHPLATGPWPAPAWTSSRTTSGT